MADKRKYVYVHNLDAQQVMAATVAWNGLNWTVAFNEEVLPDCCDTIEEAFTVAEREIARRFPKHACPDQRCRPWQTLADATE